MRTELYGLRNTETQELVLTYLASSQKHKALFSTREKAEDACKHNPQYEPFQIEAEPVKHGRWVRTEDGDWECTNCKNAVTICVCGKDRTYRMAICPNCGAKMDGGAEDA